MKAKYGIIVLILSFQINLTIAQNGTSYSSHGAFQLISRIEGKTFEHTTNPVAQWFPKAGFGLFIHWGIHSVAGIDPLC